MNLSRNAKESLKTALAMTIAYGISLQMGWDRPYWAGFAVAFISLPTIGQSLNKATLRLAGTILGAIMALTVLSLAAQNRWLFITLVSIWCGICTYAMGGSRHQYFWHVSGFVFMIIAVDGGPYPDNAFSTATLRLQQTALGILVYSLIAVFLWPSNTRQQLKDTVRSLIDKQGELFAVYCGELDAPQQTNAAKEIYAKIITLHGQSTLLLESASTDSEQVREKKALWQQLLQANLDFTSTLQQWRENFRDFDRLEVDRALPGHDAYSASIQSRFNTTQVSSDTEVQTPDKTRLTLDLDSDPMLELSHFQRAAVAATKRHLQRLDELSLDIHDLWQDICSGVNSSPSPARPVPELVIAFRPDKESLLASARLMLSLWLAFLAVLYVGDLPGGYGFLATLAPVGMLLFNSPQLSVRMLYGPTAFGLGFGSAFYIFVMPHLSGFAELGTMVFVATFYLCYRFSTPELALGRVLGLAMFLSLISVSNEQSYNFISVTTTTLLWTFTFILLNIISHVPFSPRPERAILRLLTRYFSSASYLMSLSRKPNKTGISRLRTSFHKREIASLPKKLTAWAQHADPKILGAESVGQLPILLSRIYALSYRLQELLAVREMPQSAEVARQLKDDILAWRDKVVDTLTELAENPTKVSAPDKAQLDKHLQHLEEKIQTSLNNAQLNSDEEENFYRLLSAYRGASHALLDFIDEAANVDWRIWYEERFA